jgi:hypothetical protein
MREVTRTVRVYKFGDLPEVVRERVKQNYMAYFGYARSADALASIKALAGHFDSKVSDWDIDWGGGSHSSVKFDTPDHWTEDSLRGAVAELGAADPVTGRGVGDCVLTGYFLDEDAIDGLRRAYLGGERDVGKLLQAAFRSWLDACQADFDDFYSDETFGEHCDANGWEFTEDGEMYLGE